MNKNPGERAPTLRWHSLNPPPAISRAALEVLRDIPGQPGLIAKVEAEKSKAGSEVEPNKDFNSATAIPLYTTVRGEVTSSDDIDYHKFRTPDGVRDWLHCKVVPTTATLAPQIAFHDSNRDELKEVYRTTAGAFAELSITANPATEYYLRAQSFSGSGPYELSITPQKKYDRFEPNEEVGSARPIPLGETIGASLLDDADKDWFYFQLPRPGTVRIALTNVGANLAPQIELRNADASRLENVMKRLTEPPSDISTKRRPKVNSMSWYPHSAAKGLINLQYPVRDSLPLSRSGWKTVPFTIGDSSPRVLAALQKTATNPFPNVAFSSEFPSGRLFIPHRFFLV